MSRLRPLLTRSLAAVDHAADRARHGVKRRYGLWRGLRIAAYFGYAGEERLHLSGRVLDDQARHPSGDPSLWTNAWNTLQRIDSDEVPGARVELELAGATATAEADEEGFFHFELPTPPSLVPGRRWQGRLRLLDPAGDEGVTAEAAGLYPGANSRFAVISDLDDTVVRTGATSRLRMTRTVLFNDARTRVPMPGIGALYRALAAGAGGDEGNPVFYLSSSPWNLYSLFAELLRLHGVPEGPIFLRDFGFDRDKLWKAPHEEHKPALVRHLRDVYPRLALVLAGDSGQKDAEVYRALAEEDPERVAAVLVRDVSPDARDREVRAIARELERIGVPMALVGTSAEAAERAADLGLIARDAVGEVGAAEEEDRRSRREPRGLKRWLLGISSAPGSPSPPPR
ncbi:MAG TPA: phosphatase domain-containing protein [Thermoanaerobaculia bacterium]|nr:phosphatase domain-containing protein [Thermoanaerobaculia bacterium]